MEKPGFIILVLIFTLSVVLTSCNKNEVIEPGEPPECVEGWYPSEDSGSVFYLDCPDDVNSDLGCTKYFLVLMQVENLNDKVKGVFLVKSIDEVGHEEVFFQDLDIQTQLFTVQLDFDKEKKYMHEVSVIAPRCTS